MKKRVIIWWVLAIIWLIIIFLNSSNNGTTSDSKSKNLIKKGVEVTEVITKSDINEDEVVDTLNTPVRKIAHMFEYFILAILLINALKISGVNSKALLITIAICFIYSLLDEFHQTFVVDRTGKLTDCLIDTTGCLIGCLFYQVFYKIRQKSKKNIDF